METNYIVNVYTIYVILSIVLIAWLAWTLFSNGRHFLDVVFKDNLVLSKAVNKLLVTGFIMASLGYALLTTTGGSAMGASEAFETTTKKFGALLIVLAVAHLFNMFVLNNIRKSAEYKQSRQNANVAYEKAIDQYNKTIQAGTQS